MNNISIKQIDDPAVSGLRDHLGIAKNPKTRYAVCGLSVRSIHHFVLPLLGKARAPANDFRESSEIVGILDIDQERVSAFTKLHEENIPFFPAEGGVDAMIEATRPDVLLVAGPDYTHAEHILAGLRHDLRVIVEKPVVISCAQMCEVLAAEQVSQGSLIVAHNYRYGAQMRQIKRLIMEGRVGRVTNVEFVYNLDTFHGASYFYRWNRQREKSGGLSIHKCVHHLDLISWLIDSPPETVFAFGKLNYYGKDGAHNPALRRNVSSLGEVKEQCPYFQKHYARKRDPYSGRLTPGWDPLNLSYRAQYPEDTYIYDDGIDIEDTYSAVVRYRSGVSMAYSCNFSTPAEGFILAINGTDGRIEASHLTNPDPTGLTREFAQRELVSVVPLFNEREEYVISKVEGGHGGSDPFIQRDLFLGVSPETLELGLQADSYAGALGIAAGEGIWRSCVEGRPFTIKELLGEYYR